MKATFWIICLLAGLYGCTTAEGESSKGPRHSIVFVTKRPGGYDILLEVMNERVTVCLHDKDIVVVTLLIYTIPVFPSTFQASQIYLLCECCSILCEGCMTQTTAGATLHIRLVVVYAWTWTNTLFSFFKIRHNS